MNDVYPVQIKQPPVTCQHQTSSAWLIDKRSSGTDDFEHPCNCIPTHRTIKGEGEGGRREERDGRRVTEIRLERSNGKGTRQYLSSKYEVSKHGHGGAICCEICDRLHDIPGVIYPCQAGEEPKLHRHVGQTCPYGPVGTLVTL